MEAERGERPPHLDISGPKPDKPELMQPMVQLRSRISNECKDEGEWCVLANADCSMTYTMRHCRKHCYLCQLSEECNKQKPVDIGFMLDESNSVDVQDWQNVGKFTKVVAWAASFQKGLGRASIITFDTSSKLVAMFDKCYDYDCFARAVDDLRQHRGGTNIIEALNGGLYQMFKTSKGMRKKSEKIAVLITDGKDFGNDISIFKEVGKKYQERKIKLLIVGVGNVDRRMLKELVAEEKDFFVAENFDQLPKSIVSRIVEDVQGVCEGN